MFSRVFIPLLMFLLGWAFGHYYSKFTHLIKDTFESKIATVESSFEEAMENNHSITQSILSKEDGLMGLGARTNNKPVAKPNLTMPSTFEQLLSQGRYLSAFKLYETDKNEIEKTMKQKRLEEFLQTTAKNDKEGAEKFLRHYIKHFPKTYLRSALVALLEKQKRYREAIGEQIKIEEYLSSDEALGASEKKIQMMSSAYIKELKGGKLYTIIIGFLEEMINKRPLNSFYSYELAQLYVLLSKKDEARLLLEELMADEIYANRATHLLENLESATSVLEYQYTVPLTKLGAHYIVTVYIESKPYRLIVDTGASTLFIDSAKLGDLKLLRSNNTVNTAGGSVNAKLYEAKSLTLGAIRLENIQVISAPFDRREVDGLLGMNFFKSFVFFLDQEKSLLYLNPK